MKQDNTQIVRRRSKAIRLLTTFALLMLSQHAWAMCTATQPDGSQGTAPAIFTFPGFSQGIDTTVAVGMPMAAPVTVGASYPGAAPTVTCTGGFSSWDLYSPLPYKGNNIYATGIPGVGIKIKNTQWGLAPIMGSTSGSITAYNPFTMNAATYEITLIKTGNVAGGGQISGVIVERAFNSLAGEHFVGLQIVMKAPIIVTPNTPTCSADLPDIPVTLNDSLVTTFANVGDTSVAKDFNIKLTCGGGDAGTTAQLKLGLTDQVMPGNTTDRLTVRSQTGDATGVKVQLLRNGTPQVFGPTPTTGAEPNVWPVQTITPTTGAVSIPMQARLIRTGTVTPGHVNAIAVYTVLYQ